MLRLFTKSDAQLVEQVRGGNRDAFGSLVRRYMGVVHSVAYAHVRNRGDAEDIVQNTFVRAFQSLPNLREPARFGPWITTIARRTAIDHSVKEARRKTVETAAWQDAKHAVSPREGSEMEELLMSHLDRLDDEQREVLVMRYFTGLSVKQVATVLEVRPEAAAKRLQRAREALGEKLLLALQKERTPESHSSDRVAKVMSLVAPLPMPWAASTATVAGATGAAAGGALTLKLLAFITPVVLVGAGVFVALERVPETTPPQAVPVQPEPAAPVQIPQPADVQEQAAAPEPAPTPPPLALHLKGTVTGGNPMALIAREGEASANPYHIGDALAEDVTLVAVHAFDAVVDNHGVQQVLRLESTLPANAHPPDITGPWTLAINRESGGSTSYPLLIQGEKPTYTAVSWRDNTSVDKGTVTLIEERYLVLSFGGTIKNALRGAPTPVVLTLNKERTEAVLSAEGENLRAALAGDSGEQAGYNPANAVRSVTLTRLSGAEGQDMAQNESHKAEAELIAAALRNYAKTHSGRLPASLEELVPQNPALAQIITNTDTRTITYTPPAQVADSSWQDLNRTLVHPDSPDYPDLAMDRERLLRREGAYEYLCPDVVVQLLYTTPRLRLLIPDGRLSVTEWPTEEERGVDATRAVCQNHLKQFGLIVKMFENEQRDYTPPGWAYVYPEYLSDPSILTCPKDTFGTESYEYLLPATHMPQYAAQLGLTEADIPLMLDKTPHSDGRKNVLFADGHVSSFVVNSTEWVEKVQPFLSGH